MNYRKLILSAAALCIAAVTYAQNISNVEQIGLNFTTVDQAGVENDSDVFQQGELNTVTVNQESFVGIASNNWSDITQAGVSNTFESYQTSANASDENKSTGDQLGDLNYAYVEQLGYALESDIRQNNFDGAVFGNFAANTQDGNNSYSLIDQLGDGNGATVYQAGTLNSSIAGQIGVSNQVDVNQVTFGVAMPVDIDGNLNVSFSTQVGVSNFLDLDQNGDNLFSDVLQDAETDLGGSFTNEAYVNQSGELSSSTISQFSDTFMFADNTATVNQSGTGMMGNNSTITQTGANTATVNQNSDPGGPI